MIDLKIATPEDAPAILSLLLEFHEEGPYAGTLPADPVVVLDSVEAGLATQKTDQIIILALDEEVPVGLLVGIMQPFPFSTARHATESIWFVRPDHRRSKAGPKLYEAFEYWAHKLGASVIHTGSPVSRLDKWYERKGYKPIEKVYAKWL
jgi:GNAT superfamily N-acetyltransferase